MNEPTKAVFNLYDARTHLSELVDRASAGEEIIIAKNGKPMARLIPLEKPKKKVTPPRPPAPPSSPAPPA